MGMIAGVVLLGASCLQASLAIWRRRQQRQRTQHRYSAARQSFNQQLRAVLNWARAVKPILKAWSGARPMQVAAVVDEALDCKSFYLTPEDGRPLPRFEPGQYLTFELPNKSNQEPLVRCYSLSDRPREDYYRVTIKHVKPPADHPNVPPGQGSSYFHEQVQVGSVLQVRAPQGAFFLDPRQEVPVVLIGSGIGITPIVSMLHSIVHDRSERQVYVFAGFGNSREHPLDEQLRDLCQESENVHLHINYSRPTSSDARGSDYQRRGYVDLPTLREMLPSNNFRFYVCGPAAMMESLVPALLDWGVPEDHIYFEAFGPASVRTSRKKHHCGPVNINFARAKKEAVWNEENSTLLDFAESNGVRLASGCRAGNCGQCLTKVRSGRFTHIKPPGVSVEEGQCLTCIAVPEDDLVLEA